jgi:AcrR family transcriptional regulator
MEAGPSTTSTASPKAVPVDRAGSLRSPEHNYHRFVVKKERRPTASRKPGAEDDASSESMSTRTRILDAAAHVLSENGYAGLRLSDVAAATALQAPAIYHYYASRDELVEEVMFSGISGMREHVATILDELPDDTPPLMRLLASVEAHLCHVLQTSDYATAWIRNAGQVPMAIRKRQIVEEERYGEIWRRLINDLAREGQLRPELDLYIAQMLVLGALNWAVEWWKPSLGSVEAVVENAKSLIRQGLTDSA